MRAVISPFRNSCGSRISTYGGMASACSNVSRSGGCVGFCQLVVFAHRPTDDLPDEPIGVEVHSDEDHHVRSDAFDFLRIPERESVVVAIGDENSVRLDRIEHVHCEVAGERVSAVISS